MCGYWVLIEIHIATKKLYPLAKFFVGLKPFRPAQAIAELWDLGQGDDSGPAEMTSG